MKIIENVTPAEETVPENYNFTYEFDGYSDDGTMLVSFELNEDTNYWVSNRTWQEIYDAYIASKRVLMIENVDDGNIIAQLEVTLIQGPSASDTEYRVTFGTDDTSSYFATCESADDYPSFED